MRSDRTLKKHFNYINKRYFDGQLPNSTCVRWLDPDEDDPRLEEAIFGYTDRAQDGYHKYQIVLSKKRCGPASSRFTTLVHEMIHVFTELKDDHGPRFEQVRLMLSDKGIFKKGALVRGLTIF